MCVGRIRHVDEGQGREIRRRWRTWLWLTAIITLPVLAGALWTIIGVGVLSLLCYREFARATGLFRQKLVSLIVVAGIAAVLLAALAHWYGLFMALMPLTFGVIAAAALLADRPDGYVQRVAMGTFGYGLFGAGLGHLAYCANDASYRSALLWLLVCVEANDVFAFIVGKTLRGPKLALRTSPNKTVSGAV